MPMLRPQSPRVHRGDRGQKKKKKKKAHNNRTESSEIGVFGKKGSIHAGLIP